MFAPDAHDIVDVRNDDFSTRTGTFDVIGHSRRDGSTGLCPDVLGQRSEVARNRSCSSALADWLPGSA